MIAAGYRGRPLTHINPYNGDSFVTAATREHEKRADANAPRTRAAVIRAIEHRDDCANTVF